MLGEIIKRRVINRKVLLTILLVSLTGVVDALYFFHPSKFEFALIFIYGIVSTVIIVPLMYCITIPVKNRIACAIINGVARGFLGAYLIILSPYLILTILGTILAGTGLSFAEGLMTLMYLAIIPPFLILTGEDYVFSLFTLCVVVAFMLAERVKK